MDRQNRFRQLAAHLQYAVGLQSIDGLAPIDCDLALYAKRRHRIASLLHISAEKGASVEGMDTAKILRKTYIRGGQNVLRSKAAEAQLMQNFQQAGIYAVQMKGPGLAEQIYPQPEARTSKDADILVSLKDAPLAIQLMHDKGYIPLKKRSRGYEYQYMEVLKDIGFTDPKHGTQIELHQRLFVAEPEGLTDAFLFALSGATVPSIHNSFYIFYLIMHGANANWPRLKWVIDLALLLKKHSDEHAEAVFDLARRFHAINAVKASLEMLDDIFPDSLSQSWLDQIKNANVTQKANRLKTGFLKSIQNPFVTQKRLGFPFSDRYVWDGGIVLKTYARRRLLRPVMLRI